MAESAFDRVFPVIGESSPIRDLCDALAALERGTPIQRERSAHSWHSRAIKASGLDRQDFETAEDYYLALGDAMTGYLNGRLEVARENLEAQAVKQRALQGLKRFEPALDKMTQPARERVAKEGGISHQHAVELGYESVADFLAGSNG